MCSFFSGILPELAFIWCLSLALFYRRIYLDMFKEGNDEGEMRVIPQWATLGFVFLMIILPIRFWINKCFSSSEIVTFKTYKEVALKFNTDYDQDNPLTKKEGFLRVIDMQIAAE